VTVTTDLPAAGTLLARPLGVDLHEGNTGFGGVVAQRQPEAGPAGVADRPAEPAAPQHAPHVEALGSDHAVAADQLQGDLVVVLTPQVADAGVDLGEPAGGLAAVAGTLLLAGDGTAGAAQFGQRRLEEAGVGLVLPVAGGEEGLKAHVDAHGRPAVAVHGHVRQLAAEDDVPLAGLALERQRLDLPFPRAVQLDADGADVLDAEAVVGQAGAVAGGRELDGVKAVLRLEVRVAGPGRAPRTRRKRLRKALSSRRMVAWALEKFSRAK
jgi:hypothetical protein